MACLDCPMSPKKTILFKMYFLFLLKKNEIAHKQAILIRTPKLKYNLKSIFGIKIDGTILENNIH